MRPAVIAAVVFATTTLVSRSEVPAVFASEPFVLGGGGEADVVVGRYTDSTGVACYLGDAQGFGRRGMCTLVEPGGVVGDTLVATSDKTLHNAGLAHLSSTTTIWCYADQENGLELKCRKINLNNEALEKEYELTIKDHTVHYGSSVISVAGFSEDFAVVCYDTPVSGQRVGDTPGPLECGLLYITGPGEWQGNLDVNSVYGIAIKGDTVNTLSTSVASFTADVGVVCYTNSGPDGSDVECALLTLDMEPGLPQATTAQMALSYGSTLIVGSKDARSAAVAALSVDTALVCFSRSVVSSCAKLTLSGSSLVKGEEVEILDRSISKVTIQAFSSEIAVVCFQSSASAAGCRALDVAGGVLAVGEGDGQALTVDDASADSELAVTSLTASVGLLCYTTTSNSGACRDLEVTRVTTTPHTTTATTTSTTPHTTSESTTTSETTSESSTTSLTETSSATPSSTTSFATTTDSGTSTTSETTTFATTTFATETGTTPTTLTSTTTTFATETRTTTSPHTVTTLPEGKATGEDGTTQAQVEDSRAGVMAGVGRVAVCALAFLFLWE